MIYNNLTFGEIASFHYGKMPNKQKISDNGNYPIYSGYRVTGYYDEYNLEKDELVIVARGVGGTGDVKLSPSRCYLTNLSIAVEMSEKIALKKYLYYYFTIRNLRYLDSGSAQSQITISDLEKVIIPLPYIEIQRKIVTVLSTIDDKIELNTAINENLEQQAQAIFKAWFVDFLPFGGIVPADWIETTLGDVTKNIRKRVSNNYTPVLSAINSGNLTYSDELFTKQVYSKDISKYIEVQKWDFAYNPARINIGSIGVNDLGIVGCVSPVYVVFSVQEEYHSYFRFYFRQSIFNQQAMTRASGSVRQTLNYSDFSLIDLVYPTSDYAKKFDEIWKSYYDVIVKLRAENERLSEIRDTLLPKLMNGEIDVSAVKI